MSSMTDPRVQVAEETCQAEHIVALTGKPSLTETSEWPRKLLSPLR